jgi:CDP-4-dehydro-6-deoxyglucose reductase/ferredoxin-NAD(P)+ reductase (naphthalene dioxygenase ferredoxin-specific)
MITLAASRPLYCRVVGLEDATPTIRIIRLEVVTGGPFRFAAGQYATVTFHEQPPRDYSMANRPDEPLLEFHVRHGDGGGASLFVARVLRLGDSVWVEGPYGDAWLRPDHTGPIWAVAGGSGLGPIKSIVETALAIGMKQDIHLYCGVRNEGDFYLQDRFRQLAIRYPNLRVIPVISQPQGPTAWRVGNVSDAVAADLTLGAGAKAYVAGPPVMVAATVQRLLEKGVAACDIHADPFYTVTEKDAVNGACADPL